MFSAQSFSSRNRSLLLTALIVLAAIAVYAASLRNGFVEWDDGLLITQNPIVLQPSWAAVKQAFTSYDPELYIPLTFLSYQFNVLTSGLDPFWFHLTNLFFHIGCALLVARLTWLLSKRHAVALTAGLLFAVHPLHTEAVAWASARKDVLSAFFILLSVACYVRGVQRNQRSSLVFAFIWMLLGCLSKVTAVVLPAVFLLVDGYVGRPMDRKTVREKLPFAGLSMLFVIIAFLGKVTSTAFFFQKGLLACKAVVFYLGKIILPYGFSVVYPYTQSIALTTPDIFLSVIGFAALLAVVITLWRRGYRAAPFALAWFLLFLLPTFNSVAKGHDELQDIYFASDRHAYVASVGMFFLAGLAYAKLRDRFAPAAVLALAIVTLLLGGLSYRQSLVWRSTASLFRHALQWYPNSHIAHTNVGVALYQEEKVDEALAEFEASIAVRPNGRAYYNIGQIHLLRGESEEAIASFRQAVESSPTDLDAHIYLSAMLTNRDRFDEALLVLREAEETHPDDPQVFIGYGLLYEKMGRREQALSAFLKAKQLGGEDPELKQKIEELQDQD